MFLKVLWNNLRKGPSTDPFPFGETFTPARLRGRVRFDPTACVGCRMCEYVCAGGAIRFTEEADGLHLSIWHNTCVFCGLCANHCLTGAIRLSNDWHLAHLQEDKYAMADHAVVPFVPCSGCGKAMLPVADALMRRAYKGVSERTDFLRRLCPRCRQEATLSGEQR